MFDIKIASSDQELDAIYRFRYRIYVEEMGRTQHYANSALRIIRDPLDDTAINLAAWMNNEVAGVIRNNASSDGPLGYYEDFYAMRETGLDHPSRTSITTRLMLAPEHRRGTLAIRLAVASFSIGIQRKTRWNFIDCNSHLVGFFQSLGWIEHLPQADHPEYGLVHRMRLDLTDVAHLEAVGSPFAKLLRS